MDESEINGGKNLGVQVMIFMAVCVILSLTVGMLKGRFFPLALGIYTLFSGDGVYVLVLSSACISVISSSIHPFPVSLWLFHLCRVIRHSS